MVGNDFVGHMGRTTQIKRREEPRRSFVFPRLNDPPVQNTAVAISVAAPSYPQPVFTAPTFHQTRTRYIPKSIIITAVIALTLVIITALAVVEKQHIMATINRATFDTRVLLQKEVKPKVILPAESPQKITIHSSDYYSVTAAIMTQTITLQFGTLRQPVTNLTLANWLNETNKGSLTNISVNTAAIGSYVQQIYTANNVTAPSEHTLQPVINHLANNILQAKGMTIILPTS